LIWVRIDYHSGEPIYKQIIAGITGDIIKGDLQEDQPIPSIRELAKQLNINPNTVARAYRELESNNFIYSRPGVGTFIKPGIKHTLQNKSLDMVSTELERVIHNAKDYGVKPDLLLKLCTQIIKTVYGGDKKCRQ